MSQPMEVVIVAAVRTPLGGLSGSLSSFSAVQLGSAAIKSAVERAKLSPSDIDEVFFGNVCSANLGQAPATQAMLGAGLPSSVPCTAVNKVCASGLKAVMLGEQAIRCGTAEIVVCGGMESMSNIPHYLPSSRTGLRMGHGEIVDGLIKDGLWDPYSNVHMGACAEMCASKYGFSRADQDAHALESHARARAAAAEGHTAWEVVPMTTAKGAIIRDDDGPAKLDASKLPHLRTVFAKPGDPTASVTAGNASPVTDGAAALVLMSRARAQAMKLPVLGIIRAHADAAQAPEWFTTAPALAVPKALKRAGLEVSDVDYWEVNEAFSVVDLANRRLLGLPADKVNVHGGSVALGHPIGASGARILVTLLNVLRVKGGRARFAADRGQMITIVSAYSPTEAASDEEAGDFYLRVAALADKANDKRDLLIVAGTATRFLSQVGQALDNGLNSLDRGIDRIFSGTSTQQSAPPPGTMVNGYYVSGPPGQPPVYVYSQSGVPGYTAVGTGPPQPVYYPGAAPPGAYYQPPPQGAYYQPPPQGVHYQPPPQGTPMPAPQQQQQQQQVGAPPGTAAAGARPSKT
ncbi:hypothetical protein FOA52_007617 [Chlamydomonas sp. UWO 241]|nr:hypothetical protein FOA52_007617 [Chlamydomonas sp. UWO 241]